MRKIQRYGWIPDIPDQRDLKFDPDQRFPSGPAGIAYSRLAPLSQSVNLSAKCGPVLDQGQLGSCTANATSGAITFIEPGFLGSRLFMYYNGRALEGTVNEDSGCQLRDVVKQVNKLGVCPESDWAYNVSGFAVKPGANAFATAKKDLLLQYLSIQQDVNHMKACLAAGFPFIFGFTVYDSFESDVVASSGIVPMPGPEESVIGGHAVMCIGYDDKTADFLVRNSWGKDWGQGGNFEIPYAYLSNPDLAADFWTLRKMEA